MSSNPGKDVVFEAGDLGLPGLWYQGKILVPIEFCSSSQEEELVNSHVECAGFKASAF